MHVRLSAWLGRAAAAVAAAAAGLFAVCHQQT